MKTQKSEEFFKEAQSVLVGGVNSPVRSFKGVGGHPLIMKMGKGSKLSDHDGNTYTDYCLSWGALILGHAHRNVVLAAKKTAERGLSFGTTTREEIEIAKYIVENVPSIELVRFVNSGTEATMSAARLARGYTKRDVIVKFDGCYHGHFDDYLAQAGSGVAQLAESSSAGIPKSHLDSTISLPYNNVELTKKILIERKDDIACVILEPVAGNMGVIPATKEFLTMLREVTEQYGIVLIFDEIMTGFRTSRGCVQSDYGIIPDMTTLGKIVGGGFPIGVYGGKREIMECLAPLGNVYQAGTFSGNPVVMRAGLANLRLLSDSFYLRLNQRCEDLAQELNGHFVKNGINAHVSHYKSMMSFRFRQEEVCNYQDAQAAAGGKKYAQLFEHFLTNGIYMPPADLEAFFVSGMHRSKELKELFDTITSFKHF